MDPLAVNHIPIPLHKAEMIPGGPLLESLDQAALIDTIRRGYGIAVRDLRACYNPDGIVAGRLHFNAYWARDGFWALFGALALGDHAQARAQLETFIRYQFPSGMLTVC